MKAFRGVPSVSVFEQACASLGQVDLVIAATLNRFRSASAYLLQKIFQEMNGVRKGNQLPKCI